MLYPHRVFLLAAMLATSALNVCADAITDWNIKAGEIVTESKIGTPPAVRVMAVVQTAAFEAANAITKRYPSSGAAIDAASDASIDAAIAAAHRATLTQLLPAQKPMIESAYQAALTRIADGTSKSAGVTVGESAAAKVLAMRADDGATGAEAYRPHTRAGSYVPTVVPVAPQWPQRKPWLMSGPAQFRPAAPPSLQSERWARDYNEIKAVGGKRSTARTAEQTEIARFWEATLPPIYHGLVRSIATMPGRDVTRNARLFAAVAQAADDALIAVFDAKYHYGLWRPVTAIRNGDIDDNDATERDPSWTPFIDTPMHPEYPCAHCIQAAAVGAVLQAEVGNGPQPRWTTTSSTANGAARSWPTIEAFVQEVSNARIYDGVHYRFSTEVGSAMGQRVGELAVAKVMRPS